MTAAACAVKMGVSNDLQKEPEPIMTFWRALTVKQPWTWAICYAGKRVENRTWPIPPKYLERDCMQCVDDDGFRDTPDFGDDGWCNRCNESFFEPFRVMLHAGQAEHIVKPGDTAHREWGTEGYPSWLDDYEDGFPHPGGAVVAVMTLTGSHGACNVKSIDGPVCNKNLTSCSEWAQKPAPGEVMHHWEIGDVTVLDTPVPAKGNPGLWTPDRELIDAVEAQL